MVRDYFPGRQREKRGFTVELRGKNINGNLAYKFFGAHNGPDKNTEYVSCQRQYGAGGQRFRVWLTLSGLK